MTQEEFFARRAERLMRAIAVLVEDTDARELQIFIGLLSQYLRLRERIDKEQTP